MQNPVASYFGKGYYALYRNFLIPREQSAAEAQFLVNALAPRPGERWLDLPCGYGRHLTELAGLAPQIQLVGGDSNLRYLREPGLRGTAGLACCDMRRLPFLSGSFDVALNLLNSFGYNPSVRRSAPSGDQETLSEASRVLRPGGRFILDLPDRLGLIRLVRAKPHIRYCAEDYEVAESFEWDRESECLLNRTQWSWPKGKEQAGYRLRLYTPAQIEKLLSLEGFKIEARYADFKSNAYRSGESDRMLLVCLKL